MTTSDPITRLNAAFEGRYRIHRELGEGGMATVYLADDLKHDRQVAIKVLKPELAAVVGGERFLSEIKTTANLQHPHVLPLFDSGEVDGFLFYVMPYVEGESLRERLDREKQLPVDEAVAITRKVAGALQAAHDQGVIHRDIKPANILIQRGEPLVADFGIALAVSEAGGGRLTETGLSLGTPYYMAPEQATADRDPDQRSDLFSLASVLYEMLTGEPPFTGGTAQAVLGRILTSDPVPPSEVRRAVPPAVDDAILHALEKTPADRFSSMQAWADALGRADLSWSGGATGSTTGSRAAGRGSAAGPSTASSGNGIWKVATALLAASAVALAALQFVPEAPVPAAEGVLRYELLLPVEIGANSDWGSNVAISPDGRTIAYSGMDPDAGAPGLWVRTADRLEPSQLRGADLGVHPEFSPDGSRVAFISDDRALKVASLEGRPTVTLHADPWLRRSGVSWGEDGHIYFGQWDRENGATTLHRIPESGGEVEQLTAVDTARNEASHYFPDAIPGTDLVLVTIAVGELYDGNSREIGVARLGSLEVVPLLEGMQAIWSETGHILVVRADGTVAVAAFDPGTLEVGPLIPVFEGVQVESLGSADFAIADDGTFVYVPGQNIAGSTPVWVDREGVAVPVDPDWQDGVVTDLRISPDGTRAAFVTLDRNAQAQNVWIKELDRGPSITLTSEGSLNSSPAWTADSRSVAFASNRNGSGEGFVRVVDGALPAELLISAGAERNVDEVALSPDGRWVVAQVDDDIFIQSTEPGSEPAPLLAQPRVIEGNFQISPDGRWIAYTSTESGEPRVYVRPFPDVNQGRTVVSTSSARAPRWAPDMSELYFRTLSGEFVSASVRTSPNFAVLSRTTLFAFRSFASQTGFAQYDVHPDGDRFLMVRLGDTTGRSPVVVVRGFAGEISRAVGDG